MARLLYIALGIPLACLCAQADDGWCDDLGDQFWTETADSVLTVYHDAASYNCCPDSFDIQVSVVGSLILIHEYERIGPEGGCACMCCYNLSAEIGGLAPGTYAVDYFWYEHSIPPLSHWHTTVEIPDGEQASRVRVLPFASTCLEHNPHDDVPVISETWSRLKSRFRD